MKKAVIFGANGQDGRFLAIECQNLGIKVIPFSRSANGINGDVSNFRSVGRIIKSEKPDYIFHLAANSTTWHGSLFENHKTISTGTLNILENVKNFSPMSRVFITGSGVQFKNSGEPISEETDFEASSPYAIARIHSVYAVRYYRSLGVNAFVGYLFNHESPFRKGSGISQKISQAVKRIAAGSSEKIEIGDISVEKEWAYAGDIARGILTLVQQDHLSEGIIGTGISYSIKDWIEICFNLINKDWKDYVIQQNSFIGEYKRLVSKPDKMFSIGWRPEVDIYQLARLMISDVKI